MSCTKISALLSLHWRHSAQCDCLGSCWRAVSLNEECKHAGKVLWHGPVLLQGYVYTSVSTDSWFQPQWEQSWQETESPMTLVLWMLHIMASPGSVLENVVKIMVKVLDVLNSRSVGYCGHPWQKLDRGLLNGVFQDYEALQTHTQGGLTCRLKLWLAKLWTKWSFLGKRWNIAPRDFPWESL